jgi:predicted RNA-binding Zn ribbon-like protein
MALTTVTHPTPPGKVLMEVGMGDVRRMELIGGHIAVDFVNTLGGSPERPDDEYLFEYRDLVTWLTRTGLLPPDRDHAVQHAAERAPGDAARVLEEIRRLRAALDDILRCRLGGDPVEEGPLEAIRSAYAEAVGHATLADRGTSFRLGWDGAKSVRWPLWVVAGAALDLLADAPLDRLGRCEHCRWLYLDHSRNHSRRWCSMNSCGAVAKMRRHRAARGSGPADVRH